MKPKCLWTGTYSDRAIPVELAGLGRSETVCVLPEHEAELRAYAGQARRHGRTLLVGLLSLTAVSVLAAVLALLGVLGDLATARAIGGSVIGMGALMVAVPLATPETLQAFGARRARQIARVSGGLTVAIGLAIGVWMA